MAYRYRSACDVRLPDRPFQRRWWTQKTQEERVNQAQWTYPGGLIADHCRFGSRRLVLVGDLDLDTVGAVIGQAHAVTLWTLATMYGMDQYRFHRTAPEPVRWSIHVYPARQPEPVERITDANGGELERGADTDTEATQQQDRSDR